MSYKLNSDVNFTKSVIVQGNNTGTEIHSNNGTIYTPNNDGAINIQFATIDDINNAVRGLPLVQYGNLYDDTNLNITNNLFVLQFNKNMPLFMGGSLYIISAQNIDLSSIKSNPASTTFFVYIQLIVGIPKYKISLTELPETNVNMFIGKVFTNTTTISSITISATSRFDTFRAATSQIGSAFPVSIGHPSETGTINW